MDHRKYYGAFKMQNNFGTIEFFKFSNRNMLLFSIAPLKLFLFVAYLLSITCLLVFYSFSFSLLSFFQQTIATATTAMGDIEK